MSKRLIRFIRSKKFNNVKLTEKQTELFEALENEFKYELMKKKKSPIKRMSEKTLMKKLEMNSSEKSKIVSEKLIRAVFCTEINDIGNNDYCDLEYKSMTVKRDWSVYNAWIDPELDRIKYKDFDEKTWPNSRILLGHFSEDNREDLEEFPNYIKFRDEKSFCPGATFYTLINDQSDENIIFCHPNRQTWFLIEDYDIYNSCGTCDGTTVAKFKIYEENSLSNLVKYAFNEGLRRSLLR